MNTANEETYTKLRLDRIEGKAILDDIILDIIFKLIHTRNTISKQCMEDHFLEILLNTRLGVECVMAHASAFILRPWTS